MKIAYVYLNKLGEKSANVNQTLNMVSAFSKNVETTFFSEYHTKRKQRSILEFYSIRGDLKIVRIPVVLLTGNFLIEKITRALYCLMVLIALYFSDYDVLYTRDMSFLLFYSYFRSVFSLKQKVVYEAHTIYHLTSKKVSLQQEQKALKVVDLFIPISNGISKDLMKIFNIDNENLYVSPSGVNIENFSTPDSREFSIYDFYPIAKDKRIILYTGSFKEWKGVDVLIRSVKHIDPQGFLLLVGGEGEAMREMEKLVESEGLSDRIYIEGFLPQNRLIQVMLQADIAVLPNSTAKISEKYTSPLKIFEYMASGLPIVASDLPSIQEVLKEGENCLFFIPGDEKDLGAKINKLLYSESLMRDISKENSRSSAKYSWDNRANNILEKLNYS